METNSLKHYGILGMKWGVRRYQNKDGSLTAAGKKRAKQNGDADEKVETREEKRARLLKSTDANELYKNRDMLSTAEINERLNRIDTERRLSQVAESTKKSGMDYVNSALKVARKVDEVYSFVNNSSIGKAIEKKLLGELDTNKPKTTDYRSKSVDKLSDDELKDAVTRMNREKTYKSLLKELDNNAAPKRTVTRNLLGDIADLTDDQLKDMINRLDDEKRLKEKLANR